jgi:hypothetical protein
MPCTITARRSSTPRSISLSSMFLGDPRQGNFNQNAQLLAGEVVKAATGSTNGGGEGDRQQQNANYPLNGSPQQQNESIGKTVDLLKVEAGRNDGDFARSLATPKPTPWICSRPSALKRYAPDYASKLITQRY